MIRGILCTAFALVAGAAVAAQADPKDDLAAAMGKLADAPSYSWTTTTAAGGNFTPGPAEGKTQKDGLTSVSVSFQDNAIDIYMKGDKVVVKTDSGFQTLDEIQAAGGFNPAMFIARGIKLPAEQLKGWSDKLQNIALADGVYSADLNDDSAKELLTFRRPAGAAGDAAPPPPVVKDAKGSVKFWVADGAVTKYELHLTGTRTFNDQDMAVDRTTTTEIKDVGATKVDVPDDAKTKLNG
jgi:hypothetical protein